MSRFTILMYHMVSKAESTKEARYSCLPDLFHSQMKVLASSGTQFITLKDIESFYIDNTPLPDSAVAITFDDGFMDNYDNAFPVLCEYEIPATIFLTTGLINKSNDWMVRDNFPERRMLTWDAIHEMSNAGINFGSHTVSHPRLPELPTDKIREELVTSRNTIEDKLGQEVSYLAYPHGLYNDEVRQIAQEVGYTMACSTRSGFNNKNEDLLALRRLEVYGTDSTNQLKQKIVFGSNKVDILFRTKYYFRRIQERLVK